MTRGNLPFQQLGDALSALRKKAAESLAEASGAVEIDSDCLSQYESGQTRPSEDILMLLATHFDISEDETAKLLDLAGYNQQKTALLDELPSLPTTLMVLPFDARVVYTDVANITVNEYGVVMTFMQGAPGAQPLAVARVGMSLDHAKKVLEVLGSTLAQASSPRVQKSLPAPKKSRNDSSRSS
jgi:transcriptional regulator with XRE-family HTH domain